ncbi:MAG: hypothetical protein M3Z02_11645 [Actinomycetota bacterium]|nr:hypothetical protein [Actinomycetota bacterium]
MAELDRILHRQRGLLTYDQAISHGVTASAIAARTRGTYPRWTRVLPRVYASFSGSLDDEQRRIAGLLYAGPRAQLGGLTAAAVHGLRAAHVRRSTAVVVLLPHEIRRQPAGFVAIRRTQRLPQPVVVSAMRVSPVARAVADACRELSDLRAVQALVAEAVQRRRAGVAALCGELASGPRAGSALLRSALADVAGGARSVAEADFRRRVLQARLPEPLWNAELHHGGRWLARPDALWLAAGVVFEVDSREWHLGPADWERTMLRHNRMQAAGLCVLHASPRRISAQWPAVVAELRAALRVGLAHGPVPGLIVGSPGSQSVA